MNIRAATAGFEQWLACQVPLNKPDLRHKHAAMGLDLFSFMRATYYRWTQQFDGLDSNLARAPKILAVGDLHVENFGTWRDSIGRLAWGINDFDEAHVLPYTHDLVRLATSALLAIEENHLQLREKTACRAIVEGYREGLMTGGRPFVIGEEHLWFRPLLQEPQRDPGRYWRQLYRLPPERQTVPKDAKAAITTLLPDPKLRFKIHHRQAGLGSLGKPRFTALTHWKGGPIAREAKALTLSACAWARSTREKPLYSKVLASAIRSADPFLTVHGTWVTRRLAPDCRRIELLSLSRMEEQEWLLHAMGFETANVHLGTPHARPLILRHLAQQRKGSLRKAAMKMRTHLLADFRAW
jgi:hypothetical protein